MMESVQRRPSLPTGIPSFNRILFVTDFSIPSVAAAPFAALLAEYYRSSLLVAHVIAPTAEHPEEPTQPAGIRSAEAQLQEFVTRSPLGEFADETVVRQGPVWEMLAKIVEESGVDLIVLGTHGRSGVGKLLLGSVAQKIFTLAPCPIVTISPRVRTPWTRDRKLQRILYATDFAPESLKALPYALSLARVSEAEILLLHAPESADALSGEIMFGYQQHLAALIPPEYANWCRFDTLVAPGEPARAIVDAATKNNADVVVIGAKAYEGSLAHFQVPLSIAYRIVAHAPCPVLRVRS
jgi:nucleotide-binding universal stress UspA family protein